MENPSRQSTDLTPIAQQLNLSPESIQATVDLLDEGNTVPFITRYRKDQTGGLDEQQIRQIQDVVDRRRQLDDRKERIIKSIRSQNKLTDELESSIQKATTIKAVEDLYLPYKHKKQTLATVARQRGLEPLFREILDANPEATDLEQRCATFVDAEKELNTPKDVENGVRHLGAEYYSEQLELRSIVRRYLWNGTLSSKRVETPVADNSADASQADAVADSAAETTETAAATNNDSTAGESISGENAASGEKTEDVQPAAEQTPEPSSPVEPENASDEETNAVDNDADVASETAASHDTEGSSGSAEPSNSLTDQGPSATPATEASEEPPNPDAASEPPAESTGDSHSEETVSEKVATTDEATTEDVATGAATAEEADRASAAATDTTTSDSPTDPPAPEASETKAQKPEQLHTGAGSLKSKKGGKTIAESKAELAKQRREMRKEARKRKRQKLEQSFKDYFKFKELIKKLPHHRTLALNRGEKSKVLRVRIDVDNDALRKEVESKLVSDSHPHAPFLRECVTEALNRSVIPSIERETRRELTEKAEAHAVQVFARNLRKLLLQPPLQGHRVLAIDPGFKSGCKIVALDEFGNVLSHSLVHVIGSTQRVEESRQRIIDEIKKQNLTVVAIGNGTACRETEQMIAQVLAEGFPDQEVGYLIVNEAGASVYSTSPIGREELPRFDATVRGAVSIGRRTLDPLSELVKIDPANIGVGLYQHDVKAKHLRDSLDAVVESCVNFVGVDVNSASPALLGYVSGLNQLTARRLYEHRQKNGPFKNREQFKEVPGIGESTFVQSAGFLRISDGDNPLDGTWIHPESYDVAQKVLAAIECDVSSLCPVKSTVIGTAPLAETASVETENSETADATATNNEADVASPSGPAAESETVEKPADETNTPTETQGESGEADAGETAEAEPSNPSTPAEAESNVAEGADSSSTDKSSEPMAATADQAETSSKKKAEQNQLTEKIGKVDIGELAQKLEVGRLLLDDIVKSLARPGRDPREDLSPPIFRREVIKLEDLEPGMELTGTVLNVVDFGAFVDIGLSDSGLVHVSRLSDKFISDPHDVVSVGDILTVWVIEVDEKRRRVSLTALKPGSEKPKPSRRPKQQQGSGEDQPRGEKGRKFGGRGRNKQAAGKGQGRGRRSGNYQTKAKPKEVVPITDAMVNGKEPMRTFGDLVQFYDKQKKPSEKKKDGGS